jgi:hypothetical protein
MLKLPSVGGLLLRFARINWYQNDSFNRAGGLPLFELLQSSPDIHDASASRLHSVSNRVSGQL